MNETDTSNATPEYIGDLLAQEDPEGFVDATRAAEFVGVTRRHLLEMARRGLPRRVLFRDRQQAPELDFPSLRTR